ncbi:MAG TPA: adenylate kinase [Chitinophagales bacterium]|nr:adenylate kinase [Chitinophagales bacterium]
MLNIVLFGPPGSGKGTQALKLSDAHSLIHISTGDIFRSEIKNETALGLEAKKYLDAGHLVPDEVTIRMLASFVEKNTDGDHKGIIFDGFPRTVAQAEALDKFLKDRKMPVMKVLALEVDDEELIRRILLRGKDSGRSDDNDEAVIRKRIEVYNKQTSPLKQYYRKQGKLVSLKGVGSVEEIFSSLSDEVSKLLTTNN